MSKRTQSLAAARPATRAIHSGEHLDLGPAKPTVAPIHLSTSYVFESSDDLDTVFDNPAEGYAYGRFGNPTVRALETAVAAIENCDAAIAYPSGMAAINGVLQLLAKPGDHVVVSRDVYGATLTLLNGQFAAIGVTPHFVDVTDLEATKALVDEVSPTMLFAETISNPLIKVANLKVLADIAHARDARFVVDNTFASPALVVPTDLGADLTLHSTTKYIAGHGDVLGGVIAGPTGTITALRDLARINGAVPASFDAWLTLRGLKTLHLRMRGHSENARAVVEWLQNDPRIERIYYPDVNDPATKDQFISDDRGGMVGFEVKGMDKTAAYRYLEALTIVEPATTLGDVSSLSLYPAASSHRGLTPEQRAEWNIGDNLIRLSVGIEDSRDIIDDIDQALTVALG
ncbi:MAG TPA: PLP-dependent aspartate aminotransferase family protein [Thermomicrobiales bacterium]|nr:PLP-dependent aspartate aminotransferase family protein [Thermomicrobiales bacterium]